LSPHPCGSTHSTTLAFTLLNGAIRQPESIGGRTCSVDNGEALSTFRGQAHQWKTLRGFPRYALTLLESRPWAAPTGYPATVGAAHGRDKDNWFGS
ncbi:hypothetical protein, partial [Pseudomonas sp. LA5]|uniref:hypothetical protein n=1 Tax=Pseudomonas sp. LA5 TaxID=3027850 RepID=UPI0023618E75